jgi:hypothetical protein
MREGRSRVGVEHRMIDVAAAMRRVDRICLYRCSSLLSSEVK